MISKSPIIVRRNSRILRWKQATVVVWFVFGMGVAQARSQETCTQLFRQKAFLAAGDCFQELALAMGDVSKKPETQRFDKGLFLRNAAIAFSRAASDERLKPAVSAFLRERGVALLRQYQQEKLCENASRCRQALDLETKLFRQIGYTSVAILVNDKRGKVFLRGYRFRKKHVGDWSLRVRPGTYKLRVLVPEQLPKTKTFTVVAGKPKILPFNQGVSVPAIASYTGGAIALLGGGIMLGVGLFHWLDSETVWNDRETPQSRRDQLIGQRQGAQVLQIIGTSLAITGLVAVLVGAALHKPALPKRRLRLLEESAEPPESSPMKKSKRPMGRTKSNLPTSRPATSRPAKVSLRQPWLPAVGAGR